MDQPPNDPWLDALVVSLLLASVAAWCAVIGRWRRRGAVLDYEPRLPVPWGAAVALLAVVFVAISLLSSVGVEASQEPSEPMSLLEASQRLMGIILFQTVVIGVVVFAVAVAYRASLRDFGLPEFAHEMAHDVAIGVVACLVALAPVYGIQMLLLELFGPSHHPLVELVTSGEPNVGIVFLATIAAVVIAPISEEILFRLLLQGWLEKWEGGRLAWRGDSIPELSVGDEAPLAEGSEQQNGEARMTNDEFGGREDSSFVIRHSSFSPPVDPPPRGLAGLPYGWAPILISSLLFAAAHYGYGPDPVPIFFLAIILGYVYQRTHRITPCIVAHALFNSLAMLVLWWTVFFHVE